MAAIISNITYRKAKHETCPAQRGKEVDVKRDLNLSPLCFPLIDSPTGTHQQSETAASCCVHVCVCVLPVVQYGVHMARHYTICMYDIWSHVACHRTCPLQFDPWPLHSCTSFGLYPGNHLESGWPQTFIYFPAASITQESNQRARASWAGHVVQSSRI